MTPLTITDPRKTLQGFLVDHWDSANTSDVTPEIHTGWYNARTARPQVTLNNPLENAIRGGDTGFAAFNPGSGKPTQLRRGVITANLWAIRGATKSDGSEVGENPKQLLNDFVRELERLIIGNFEIDSDISYWSVEGWDDPGPDLEADPPVFRLRVRIVYGWIRSLGDGSFSGAFSSEFF